MSDNNLPTVPYALTRVGVIMTPDPDDPLEADGVLNPASGRGPDGELYLLPRIVATGNVSRVGLARVVIEGGVPVGVERQGVVLAPDRSWERGVGNAGVEDPRVTWIEALGLHVMTYVAYGPLGPRTALAVSTDLREWRRLGPVLFEYVDELDIDLNLFHNTDSVFFPEQVTGPDGVRCFAALHRPMWDLGETKAGQGVVLPAGTTDPRQSIWISYVPVEAVERDLSALTLWSGHRFVAGPVFPLEETKIGGGPAPVRVPEGWLVLQQGVT
ncbi:MAG: glycosidase, partial [Microbacterium sp.]